MTVKTPEHILETTRSLFNARGESSVTASDVALELGISTGNLYYHFKGKEALHLALFAKMQREMVVLMGPAVQPPGLFTGDRSTTSIETSWLFLTVILEKMLKYRYLYENPRGVIARFADIDRGFRRLLRMKQKVCGNIAEELIPIAGRDTDPQLATVTNTMTLCMNCWLSYDPILNPQDPEALLVHRGVLQILSHCAPYLGNEQRNFYNICEQLYQQMVDEEATPLD